ncbi:MAG: LacI family DNA-binding transcriptional regulator [Clostridia bacterium]|nr:LacI family DNA-binding transcriptional regulator [Clostridia bacterium]MBR1704137.1 LacI family DNA-binding transcriptional regulator [Clostridia bacterium]
MTLREIAELAGVSPSAVSRYLNGGSLSSAKYEAIDKVIKETGYVPNQVAHNLRTGHVKQVGIVVPKIHSQSVSQLVEGAHEVLSQAGYMTVLGSLGNEPSSVSQYLDWMQSYHMAGAIVMAANDADVRNGTFARCEIPLVITGQHFKDFSCVYHDDWGAAKDLTQLLLEAGRKKIVCISGPKTDPAIGTNRVEGVKAALWEAGITPALPTVVSSFDMESGKAAMHRLLKDHPDLDGVFCATDSMGHGALLALKEAGKRVPEDVSVVAFGNDWANEVSEPRLTTAELYQTQCGRDAATLLLEAIEQEKEPGLSRQIMLGYKIVKRGSV